MSTLKLEHIANINNAGPDISIDSSGHLNIVNGNLQMGGVTMLDASTGSLNATGIVTAVGGNTNNTDDAAVFKGTGTEHIKLLLDTSSTGGHRASVALESNSNEVNIATTGSDEMRFSTANTSDALFIKSDGNVGIGTTSPNSTLTLQGNEIGGQTITYLHLNSGNNTISYPFLASVNSNNVANSTYGWLFRNSSDNGNLEIFRKNNSTTPDIVMAMSRSNGNVGIGTDDPSSNLEVAGGDLAVSAGHIGIGLSTPSQYGSGVPTLHFQGTSPANTRAGAIYFTENTGDQTGAIYSTDGSDGYGGIILHSAQGDMKFSTGALQDYRIVIDTSGNVGIGITSPAQLLHVQAGGTGNGTIRVGGGAGLEISHDNSANTVQRIDSLYRTTSADANLQLRTGILTVHIGTSTTEYMRLDGANGLQVMTDTNSSTNADNVSIRYNGTSGGHQSGYLFRDKRNVVNAAIKNDLQDDGVGTAAAHLRFQTSHGGTLTTQMTIDRYGQVMMPNQPSFRAHSTNDYTANGVLESANWTEQHDNNNDFSNGRFTAPVDGVYLFEVMWDSNGSQGGLTLLKNASSYIVRWEPTGLSTDGWESRHYSTTVKLSSGDYVRLVGVHASGTNPYHMGGGHWGFFSGHLLG